MDRENANSSMLLLTLIRPADSLCPLVSAFLRQQGHEAVMCSTIYDVVSRVGKTPAHQPVVVIVRPAQIPPQAGRYLIRQVDTLRLIGWLDAEEHLSDRSLLPDAVGPMVMVSSLVQLKQAIDTFSKEMSRTFLEQRPQPLPGNAMPDPLTCDLSAAEVHALIGVNQ
jgi:hypothetical protein